MNENEISTIVRITYENIRKLKKYFVVFTVHDRLLADEARMVNHGVNNSLRWTVHVDVSRYLDSMAGYNMSLEVLQDTNTVLLRYSKQTVFFVKILSTHKGLKSQYFAYR